MIEREKHQVPADAINALARCLLPVIRSYFESEEGRREYANWQAARMSVGIENGASPDTIDCGDETAA